MKIRLIIGCSTVIKRMMSAELPLLGSVAEILWTP
jgi:hypothetical protein